MKKIRILLLIIMFTSSFIPVVRPESQFSLDIALGNLPGWNLIHKFGHLESVLTTEQTVWSNGTIYPFLDAATLLNVSSSDVDDDLFDTGAWNITIQGLNANYVQTNETIVLDGQNPVSSVNQYLRIHRMFIRKSGSSLSNEGTIYAGTGATVAGKPLNVYAMIDPDSVARFTGYGQTQMAVFTVPVNKTGLLCTLILSSIQKKTHEFYFMIRPFNESWRRIEEFHFETLTFEELHEPCFPIEARTDIMVTVIGESAGGAVSVSFDMILVDAGFEVVLDEQVSANNTLLYLVILVLGLIALGSNMRKR